MKQKSGAIDSNARIAIIGAGPAGLSTAWFLLKNGFHNVTVLEKLGRVGGLCKSITIDGMSYDIGANYVTWATAKRSKSPRKSARRPMRKNLTRRFMFIRTEKSGRSIVR